MLVRGLALGALQDPLHGGGQYHHITTLVALVEQPLHRGGVVQLVDASVVLACYIQHFRVLIAGCSAAE